MSSLYYSIPTERWLFICKIYINIKNNKSNNNINKKL